MDASYKIQRGIHVHLIQFFMCPEFWVHIRFLPRFFSVGQDRATGCHQIFIDRQISPDYNASKMNNLKKEEFAV